MVWLFKTGWQASRRSRRATCAVLCLISRAPEARVSWSVHRPQAGQADSTGGAGSIPAGGSGHPLESWYRGEAEGSWKDAEAEAEG
jgi:hypothetical protein